MAAVNTIQLQPAHKPTFYREPISHQTLQKATDILQENHERHHIFFNTSGFHNHIVHHILTLLALRATPDQLQKAYSNNSSYQRPKPQPHSSVIDQLHEPAKFMKHLGPEEHYTDFLVFFQREIQQHGWQHVLQTYLFAGDERAETMLVRTYAGLVHPLIHLGFAIEFEQPAVIAEALAEAACHSDSIGQVFLPAENAAKTRSNAGTSKSIVQLLDECHNSSQIRNSVKWSDANKIRALLNRAGDRFIDILSQVHVKPEELEEKTAEMTMAATYFTGGAQRADRAIKYDFFFIHDVNSSIWFTTFLKQDWLSKANKVRLLEWKIRSDITDYAARKSPEVRLQDIRNYKPKQPSGWDEVEDRACDVDDDGHLSKLVRALANGEKICRPYEHNDAFHLKGADWLQLGHMAVDSIKAPGANWVRSAGFDEAWENIPPRSNESNL